MGVLVATVLMGAGCSAASTSDAPAPAEVDLVGTTWNCYEFAVGATPQPVLSTAPITAEFAADGTLSGSAGVNTYNTGYKTEGESIEIDEQIATTMMAGPDDAMRQETDYLTTLPTAATFSLKGDELVLFGPAQNMIARYRPAE